MKHFFFILLFSLSSFAGNAQTKAQSGSDFKIAYFDVDSLLEIMPEFKAAADSAQAYYVKLEIQMNNMNIELERLTEEIASKDLSPAAGAVKAKELAALQERIEAFKEVAQEEYEEYKAKLLEPLFEKIKVAAKKVAKEKGYAFVLDGSKSAAIVIFASESYNIFDDMCEELGIPVPKKK